MRRYRVGLETRARILEATRALLAEVGLEATTIKRICQRAGVGAGSFYNLFRSKEECVLTVVGEAIDGVAPEGDASEHETVADLVRAYVTFVTSEPLLARVYLQAAAAWGLSDPALGRRFRRHQARRAGRLAAALRRDADVTEDEARERSEQLLATLNGLVLHWFIDPDVDLIAHRDRLIAETVAVG